MMRVCITLLACSTLALSSCGDDGDGQAGKRATTSHGVSFDQAIAEAQQVRSADFPAPQGRTLQQMAHNVPAINLGLATATFIPGKNRLAFGLIDEDNQFVYGKTAVYLARRPGDKARGPFPAPADPLVVEPPFRSRGAAQETDEIAAIYESHVELPKAGRWFVLAMARSQGRLFGAASQIDIRPSSPIPAVGERPPRVDTETLAGAGGDIESIETRVPPDDMHEHNVKEVLGRRPVVLLFATPALCQTRVCGPVTDIAAQLQDEYGDQATFIHQEVYEENNVSEGLRKPLREFGLRTEPWLFTFDREGRVAARLEGSFGNDAFRRAVEAALD